ncbi:MAG: TetR/AcrR family transcriptional regulator [Alphaproteobacteria bacterium]|nr:TetR/AcrR family transcriptional regulator [Alphaproteobacteria bacterium]
MARVTAQQVEQTKHDLLEAARFVLTTEGFAGLSTRRVADAAKTQMSQIQYHFGSKEGMILALFQHLDAGLIQRQSLIFDNPDLSISEKWSLACDYLDKDLDDGYVCVLQELIAAGWSNDNIGTAVRSALGKWHSLLSGLAREAAEKHGTLGPFTPASLAALIACAFIGAEALILVGYEDRSRPVREALRQVGHLIALLEGQSNKE